MLSGNIYEGSPKPLGLLKLNPDLFYGSVFRGKPKVLSGVYPSINLNDTPVLPLGCTLEYDSFYSKGGKVVWNKFLEGERGFLTPTPETRLGLNVSIDLSLLLRRNEVSHGIAVFNFLLANPNQIPKEWNGHVVTFRGAILKHQDLLAYPSLDCFENGGCFASYSSLFISVCIGIGRLLK